MCLMLESEVILANVLSNPTCKYGIDRDGITEYCMEIKKELSKMKDIASEYVYFDITSQSIKNAIELYQDFFVEIGGRICSYKKINVDYFNSRFQNEISDSLKKAADNYCSKIKK